MQYIVVNRKGIVMREFDDLFDAIAYERFTQEAAQVIHDGFILSTKKNLGAAQRKNNERKIMLDNTDNRG